MKAALKCSQSPISTTRILRRHLAKLHHGSQQGLCTSRSGGGQGHVKWSATTWTRLVLIDVIKRQWQFPWTKNSCFSQRSDRSFTHGRFLKTLPAPDAQLTSEGKGLAFSRPADQHADHGRLDAKWVPWETEYRKTGENTQQAWKTCISRRNS